MRSSQYMQMYLPTKESSRQIWKWKWKGEHYAQNCMCECLQIILSSQISSAILTSFKQKIITLMLDSSQLISTPVPVSKKGRESYG